MIRKFAGFPGFSSLRAGLAAVAAVAVLAGVQGARAQDAQPQTQSQTQQSQTQQPENQQSSSQEASPEESTSLRRNKPRPYDKWDFNVGGGASLTTGATKDYVRGGGGVGAVGVARNYSQFLGLRADFQWDNLPLRDSALQLAQAPGATSQVYSLMLDPIISLPFTKEWTGYFVIGPSYYHRSGKLDSSSAQPGSACNGFWTWWGACYASSIQAGHFLSSSQNEFGENFGAGVAHKITPKIELYGEFRILHGSHNGLNTDLRPITIGVRW